jgi:hypothetical protein
MTASFGFGFIRKRPAPRRIRQTDSPRPAAPMDFGSDGTGERFFMTGMGTTRGTYTRVRSRAWRFLRFPAHQLPAEADESGGLGTQFPAHKCQPEERSKLPTSVMPEGLVADLSLAQFASLLDYIEGMKIK